MALDDYLPYDDLDDLMDWLDGERLYAAGRRESTRAQAFAEVQREGCGSGASWVRTASRGAWTRRRR